jgi:hypothetical protein
LGTGPGQARLVAAINRCWRLALNQIEAAGAVLLNRRDVDPITRRSGTHYRKLKNEASTNRQQPLIRDTTTATLLHNDIEERCKIKDRGTNQSKE